MSAPKDQTSRHAFPNTTLTNYPDLVEEGELESGAITSGSQNRSSRDRPGRRAESPLPS